MLIWQPIGWWDEFLNPRTILGKWKTLDDIDCVALLQWDYHNKHWFEHLNEHEQRRCYPTHWSPNFNIGNRA